MSHYTTMHATTINYSALPPTSPLQQLPLPYLPPPPPPSLSLPPLLSPPPPPASSSDAGGFQSRISPSVLLIILILAVIFFVSGLLHLLVRLLVRPAPRDPAGGGSDAYGGDANGSATAFQGQLQQLFHLHDAGVDQSFIDALPVFLYGAVVGGTGGKEKEPFDCAVCLCEFADDDRLRLLPKCSHAFHVDCIDTWLLSHSTCPLCRRSLLLADFSSPCGGGGASSCTPLVFVLESASEGGSVVSLSDRLDAASSARLSFVMEQEQAQAEAAAAAEKKDGEVVVPVKLGKFRSQQATEGGGGVAGGGSQDDDVRRCFSMGTYEYVMDDTSLLRVAVKPPEKNKRPATLARHRVAMSECDCHSKREGFRGFDAPPPPTKQKAAAAAVGKRESFSISKIWMRGGGGGPRTRKDVSSSGGATATAASSSFRVASALALQRAASDVGAVVAKRRAEVVSPVTESEYNVSTAAWDKSASGSVVDWDVESANGGGGGEGHGGLCSRADEAPSFARRTLLWIRGHL